MGVVRGRAGECSALEEVVSADMLIKAAVGVSPLSQVCGASILEAEDR
jgi:hypothetical protein